jgi:hypothetical protein
MNELMRVQKQIAARIDLFGGIAAEQEAAFVEVEGDLLSLVASSTVLSQQSEYYRETQNGLTDYAMEVSKMVDASSKNDLSDAERAFQREIIDRKNIVRQYRAKLTEVQLKAEKLMMLQRQQAPSQRPAPTCATADLTQAQQDKMRPLIVAQTAAIGECMKKIETLKQRLVDAKLGQSTTPLEIKYDDWVQA